MLVTAVALIGPDGFILMQQRRFSGVHGGLWEFPGGKLEPGERPEIAGIRELKEELDVHVAADALEAVGFASGFTEAAEGFEARAQRPLVIFLYACRAWRGVPQAQEAEAVAWYPPDAIASLSMPPLDYPLAEALKRYLGA
ncbi:MAG: (deoxy)nucleoside triphosphate pyrophosphohydrolase [Novosphingobium sp.]